MSLMLKSLFYRDANFSIALWEGNTGDVLPIHVDEPLARKDFLCFSVCLRGRLKMYDPTFEDRWAFEQGSVADEGGDFDLAGQWTWTVAAPNTQELCFARIDAKGDEIDVPVNRAIYDYEKGQTIDVEPNSIVVIGRGSFNVKINSGADRVFDAPSFLRIETPKTFTAIGPGRIIVVTP